MRQPFTVRHGGFVVPVSVVSGGSAYRISVYDPSGRRHRHTFKDEAKARAKAKEVCKTIARGTLDLAALSASEMAVAREAIRVGLTLEDVRAAAAARVAHSVTVSEAIDEMLQAKRASMGPTKWLRTLRGALGHLAAANGDKLISQVSTADIEHILAGSVSLSERSRRNVRAAIVELFRWAQRRGYIPEGETAADKSEPIAIPSPSIEVFRSDEMREAIELAGDALPWILFGGFAGLRTEEITPEKRTGKPGLDWSTVDLDNMEIFVPAEVAKGKANRKRARIVPIADNLAEMIRPLWRKEGRVCPTPFLRGLKAMRAQGFKHKRNGFRKSFATYRTAVTQNPQQVSLEMGNSAPVLNMHYRSPEARRAGDEWFSIGL